MIDIDLDKISENASRRFEEFEKAVAETSGVKFGKDRELFLQVFCSGYWRALNEVIETIESQKFETNKELN